MSLDTVERRPGEMGGAFDVVNAVFADAGAVAGIGSLLVAYRTWRDTRSRAPRLRIEKDGVSVTVENGSDAEIRRIIDVLFPEGPDDAESAEEGAGEQ
ncbi:hypothetical protein GCM10009780_06860 [Actinomadura alba]